MIMDFFCVEIVANQKLCCCSIAGVRLAYQNADESVPIVFKFKER